MAVKINGNQVILDKKDVSDWLCSELEMVYRYRQIENELSYHLDLLEGSLETLIAPTELFRKIHVKDPTDENLFRAYQAVTQEFGPSFFNSLANLGGERHAE